MCTYKYVCRICWYVCMLLPTHLYVWFEPENIGKVLVRWGFGELRHKSQVPPQSVYPGSAINPLWNQLIPGNHRPSSFRNSKPVHLAALFFWPTRINKCLPSSKQNVTNWCGLAKKKKKHQNQKKTKQEHKNNIRICQVRVQVDWNGSDLDWIEIFDG